MLWYKYDAVCDSTLDLAHFGSSSWFVISAVTSQSILAGGSLYPNYNIYTVVSERVMFSPRISLVPKMLKKGYLRGGIFISITAKQKGEDSSIWMVPEMFGPWLFRNDLPITTQEPRQEWTELELLAAHCFLAGLPKIMGPIEMGPRHIWDGLIRYKPNSVELKGP